MSELRQGLIIVWLFFTMTASFAAAICSHRILNEVLVIRQKLDCIALPDGPVVPVKPREGK